MDVQKRLLELQDPGYRDFHSKLLPKIREWAASDHVYTNRFGIEIP